MAPRPPDFLCIGAAKAGTTWLYQMLSACPGYWMPPEKEIRYFGRKNTRDRDEGLLAVAEAYPCKTMAQLEWLRHYVRGEPKNDAWYYSLFAEAGDSITGDISPPYGPLPARLIRRAKDAVPNATIIMIVRNPIDRLLSNAIHALRLKLFGGEATGFVARRIAAQLGISGDGPSQRLAVLERYRVPWQLRRDVSQLLAAHNAATGDALTFKDLAAASGKRISPDMLRESLTQPYVQRQGMQSSTIRQWRDVFGERLHIFLYDDLVADPVAFLARVTETLGRHSLPLDRTLPHGQVNAGYIDLVDGLDEFRAGLVAECADEIGQLRDLLGDRVDCWG